jgi:hypothetical protein
MKHFNSWTRFTGLLTVALMGSAWGFIAARLSAAETNEAQPKPAASQRLFASPDEAATALRSAVAANDHAALVEIFGSEVNDLLTTDKTQDANNARQFAAVLGQGCTPVKEGDNKIIFEIGTNNWPMAIPLVKEGAQWRFDTAAGKEEIINRHIGKDELHAIGVCRAYVTAQQQYAGMNPNAKGGGKYAQKFKSTPGKKDGLYWPAAENEPASPFGSLVAEAHAEGYVKNNSSGPHPFHGYYFRILMRQGSAAPGGKMNYMSHGNLTGGFALVAYPESWNQSGIMTFMVSQDGKVFQCNLGGETLRIAGAMKEYNPEGEWTLVPDKGLMIADSEK